MLVSAVYTIRSAARRKWQEEDILLQYPLLILMELLRLVDFRLLEDGISEWGLGSGRLIGEGHVNFCVTNPVW